MNLTPRKRLLADPVARAEEKAAERDEHNETYGRLAREQLARRRPEDYVAEVATPAHVDDGVLAGTVNADFLRRVLEILDGHDKATVRILDYGCGMGKLSLYLAQLGYEHIQGFDLSDEGVAFGTELAELHGLGHRIELRQMDAEDLAYDDDSFDVVIGKAVLHHTIKYPRTASELARVMRPGAVAIFKENIGDNPLLKVGRFVTMDLRGHHGDVNITSKMLDDYARPFASVAVDAQSCAYMVKRLLWRSGTQPGWRKAVMQTAERIDDATVHRSERLRRALCGEAVIELRA